MYRDRLAQYNQAAVNPILAETADSIARARDYQRRTRAEFLTTLFDAGSMDSFDWYFADYCREDDALVLFLPTEPARRALSLIKTGQVQ